MADDEANPTARLLEELALSRQPLEDVLALKERALGAASEGITIADVRLSDEPLIYVNAGFERLTGYSAAEVIGRNCRFLQGPEPLVEPRDKLRAAIRDRRGCTVELQNYRKDGTPFWNRLSITPVSDESGTVTHFIGIQSDVTARREAEDAREEALSRLEVANKRMKANLDAAARMQRALLPASAPSYDGIGFTWTFEPCDELAGDTLNVLPLDARRVALFLLDVSGHGVRAALLSVTLSRWLSTDPEGSCLFSGPSRPGLGERAVASPRTVLERLNREFPMTSESRQYFTMVYGVLDTQTRQLRLAVAGHPPPIFISAAGDVRQLGAGGMPVGMLSDTTYDEHVLQLDVGDRLYIYSDGLSEVRSAEHGELGRDRLADHFRSARSTPLDQTLSGVVAEAKRWCGGVGFDDDVSILALEAGARSRDH